MGSCLCIDTLLFFVRDTSWWSFHFTACRTISFFITTGEYSEVYMMFFHVFIQRLKLYPILKIFQTTLQKTPLLRYLWCPCGWVCKGSLGHDYVYIFYCQHFYPQNHVLPLLVPRNHLIKQTWERIAGVSSRITWCSWERGEASELPRMNFMKNHILRDMATLKGIQLLREKQHLRPLFW